MRFQVRKGSQSAHCCFEATVVDTDKPTMIGGKQYNEQFNAVCECFDKKWAEAICIALNSMSVEEIPE